MKKELAEPVFITDKNAAVRGLEKDTIGLAMARRGGTPRRPADPKGRCLSTDSGWAAATERTTGISSLPPEGCGDFP